MKCSVFHSRTFGKQMHLKWLVKESEAQISVSLWIDELSFELTI